MNRWLCSIVTVGFVGVAQAQGGLVEKPAPSRFYGTARPAVQQPAPAVAPPQAPAFASPPASVQRPPLHDPGVRHGGGFNHAQPVHSPRPIYVQPARRPHVDIVIGAPVPRPYYYGPRYGYPGYVYPGYGYGWGYPYPPQVVVPPPVIYSPPAPTVYIERPPEPAPPAATEQPLAGYWYWCADPQGWYPNVGECAGGWQPVPPRAAQ
jgi:hypothetical protein